MRCVAVPQHECSYTTWCYRLKALTVITKTFLIYESFITDDVISSS